MGKYSQEQVEQEAEQALEVELRRHRDMLGLSIWTAYTPVYIDAWTASYVLSRFHRCIDGETGLYYFLRRDIFSPEFDRFIPHQH